MKCHAIFSVNVSATILNVLDMKELEGFWQVKVTFDLRWIDSRLQMQNLKENDNLNVLADEERSSIWFPEIVFGNNDNVERMVLDAKGVLIVRKEGEGEASAEYDIISAEVFEGFENPFFYSRTYSTKFECDYQLQSYPFDTQECTMDLDVPSSQRAKVEVRGQNISYTGMLDLPQFTVTKTAVTSINRRTVFVMTFKRKIAYHVISVYLPSMTIFIISLVTLFVHIKHIEATIMVHLTAMLVMYTLFQAISVSLPKVKTSYVTLQD